MNKKLLALAIAGALAAPLAAQADVSVYGLAHLSFDALSGADDAPSYGVVSRASRLGFKASEDLGGGLKAIAGIEFGVDMAKEKGGETTGRNQVVGLAGGFGTVVLGRHDTPYKMSTGKLDPFGDQLGDYNAVIGPDLRLGNVLAYLSPSFNGLNINAAIVTDNNATTAGLNADENDPSATSVAVTYGNGPLFVAVARETVPDVIADTRIGVGYDIAGFGLGFVYESNDIDGGDSDPTAVFVSAKYGMGAATLKASYGKRDWDGIQDDDTVSMAIGVDYALSKATKVYAQYASLTDGTAAGGLIPGAKLQDAYLAADADGEMSGLSLGMVYKF